jgi:hypothetical protein
MKNTYRILVWKPEWKKPLVTPTCRQNDMKMAVKETGVMVDWIHLAWDMVHVNMRRNLQVL